MEKINGIIKDGKVYEAVEIDEVTPCEYCDFWEECSNSASNIEPICSEFIGDSCIFRYSPSLTERLNNPDLLNGKRI